MVGIALLLWVPTVGWTDAYERGLERLSANEQELALYHLQVALHQGVVHPAKVYWAMGQAWWQLGQTDKARQAWQSGLAAAPDVATRQALQESLTYGNLTPAWRRRPATHRQRLWSTQTVVAGGPEGAAGQLVGLSATGPDYLAVARYNGETVRWALNGQPIKLFVDEASRPPGSAAGLGNLVVRAFDPWVQALGGQLAIQSVAVPTDAHIVVRFTTGVDRQGVSTERGTLYTAGITVPFVQDKRLQQMVMTLATLDIDGAAYSADALYNVALHEAGHALGLLGHSPNPNDVMYGETLDEGSERGVQGRTQRRQLSSADVASIRRLYQSPAGITNAPSPPAVGGLASLANGETRLAASREEIAKRQQEAALRGTRINWFNLQQACLQFAKLLEDTPTAQGNHGTPRQWIETALEAANQAIAAEPGWADSYFQRGLIYELLNRDTAALNDFDQALKRGVENRPRVLLEKAWILAGQNRRAEALNVLDEYRQLQPAGGSPNPLYTKIQEKLGGPSL